MNQIETRARGRVVAQSRYLERQRKKKEAQVDRIAGSVAAYLYGEVGNLCDVTMTLAQRRRILDEIINRARAILLSPTAEQEADAGQTETPAEI
jgi:hypothetical protein